MSESLIAATADAYGRGVWEPLASATVARMKELRHRLQSGRLDWRRSVADAFAHAGLGTGYTLTEWAETPWFGPLECWRGPGRNVSDILINAPQMPVIVVEQGQHRPTTVVLHPEWVVFTQRQLLLHGGLVTPAAPDAWAEPALIGTADRHLRFAVTRPPLTPDGPTIAVRVLPRTWATIDDLVRSEVLVRPAAEVLVDALRHGVSVLVAGGTGSGKTTLTAALLQAIGGERRVVVIEEAGELPRLPDSVHIEVVRSGLAFAACVRFALRQKPHLIVVGEARGPEALAMLQAAATGHPGIGTIHAPDVQAALKNLERMACEGTHVPASIVRAMLTSATAPLLVVHIGRYGGQRRVGVIAEVVGTSAAGTSGDNYALQPLYQFNPHTGAVERVGQGVAAWHHARA